mmetsp:Transcript_39059/g.51084  ORF Transcript_39059/g.51084 Transcript_39059/m.51084 type:complete len:85 (-) Transcript_39059:29-283(-)
MANELDFTRQQIQNKHSDDFMIELDDSLQRKLLTRTNNDDYLLMSQVENAELIYRFAGSMLTSEDDSAADSKFTSQITSHFTGM